MKLNGWLFLCIFIGILSCKNDPFDTIYPEDPKIIQKTLNLNIQSPDNIRSDTTYNVNLDLDLDGTSDYVVYLEVPYYPYPDESNLPLIASISNIKGNNHKVLATPYANRGLNFGDSISGDWEDYTYFKRDMGEKYFGIRLEKGIKRYYGWIKIKNTGERNKIEVISFAIRIDGKALKAGE